MGISQMDHQVNAILSAPYDNRREMFGRLFKGCLEQSGLTTRDIAHKTRISLVFLDALCEGQIEKLPGEIFGRGFIRNACKLAKVESAGLIIAYNSCFDDSPALESPIVSPEKSINSDATLKGSPGSPGSPGTKIEPENSAGVSLKTIKASKSSKNSKNSNIKTSSTGNDSKSVDNFRQPAAENSIQKTPRAFINSTHTVITALDAFEGTDQTDNFSNDAVGSLTKKSDTNQPLGVGGVATQVSARTRGVSPRAGFFALAGVGLVLAGLVVKYAYTDPGDVKTIAKMTPVEKALNQTKIKENSPGVAPAAQAEGSAVQGIEVDESLGGRSDNSMISHKSITADTPAFEQVVEMKASESVKIKKTFDSGKTEEETLAPGAHKFVFDENAEFLIYDAGSVEVIYNGQPIGSLGNKGRIRRISFSKKKSTTM